MGYDVDRRGQIASPDSTTRETESDSYYWAVVKSGCSVSCGGGKVHDHEKEDFDWLPKLSGICSMHRFTGYLSIFL